MTYRGGVCPSGLCLRSEHLIQCGACERMDFQVIPRRLMVIVGTGDVEPGLSGFVNRSQQFSNGEVP